MTRRHSLTVEQWIHASLLRHWVQFIIFILVLRGGKKKSVLFRESYSCSRVYQPAFCWGIQRQRRVSAWACDAVIIIPISRHKTSKGLHNYFFFSSTHDLLCCVEWRRRDVFVLRESHIMGWHRCQTSPTFQGFDVGFFFSSNQPGVLRCPCKTDNCGLGPCIDTPWSVC